MYPVAYMNYGLLHLNLYGSSNSVLCVLIRLKCMLDVCMYVFPHYICEHCVYGKQNQVRFSSSVMRAEGIL
jgi:hypothetical protein